MKQNKKIMNKKGEFISWWAFFFCIFGGGIIAFTFIVIPTIEKADLDEWCVGEGFDYGEYRILGDKHCVSIENNTLTKVEIEDCEIDGEYRRCFVK